MWQRWFQHQSVGIGWPPQDGYRLDGSTPGGRGWPAARAALKVAFIHYYTKLNAVSPSEADIQRYFKVSPPSVHNVVLTLESRGYIERVPGQPRSIGLRLAREELPDLE